MRAVILAGGRGTRLRPYTTIVPKPLVPVGDRAVMEILVEQLARHGCDRITVALGHQSRLIMAYFGDGRRFGLDIDYSVEERPLSTIGPLRLVPDLPDHFLVMNGDILTDLDYARLLDSHAASGADATIATFQRDHTIDFGVLEHEPDGRIVSFSEKPRHRFSVSMGVYALSRTILDLVPEDRPYGFDHLMRDLIGGGHLVRAWPFDGYWLDIGRPEDYDRANAEFETLRNRLLPWERPTGGQT